jgi:signal transduction histidine kinase/ligand-binding sensor domain-containing protein
MVRWVLAAPVRDERSWIARVALLAIFFVFSAIRLVAVDPTSHISQYGHTVWRVQDGYFAGVTNAVAQTADGYIWVGTDSGLFKFDGVRFVRWSAISGEQLPPSRVVVLLAARDGSLWIGTDAGLAQLVKNRLILYQKNEGWSITHIFQDASGTIWFRRLRAADYTHTLCQMLGTETRCYGKEDGVDVYGVGDIAQDPSGELWIGGETSFVRWKPGTSEVYRPQSLQSNEGNGGVLGLAIAKDGSLWVGMPNGRGAGLQHMINGALRPLLTPKLNSETLRVLDLYIDHQNSLWVGTNQGLYRIIDNDLQHYGSADGLSGDFVYRIIEDREGNLWVATQQGLDMFRDLRVQSISKSEGLIDEEVESVAASRDGSVWIGSDRLLVLGPKGLSRDTGRQLSGNTVTSLFEDHAGRFWVGIKNELFVHERGRFHRITKSDGHALGMVMSIAEDSKHNIWVESAGPPSTLFRIEDLHVREEFRPPAIPLARKIVADPAGGIWLGLVQGDLARYRDGRIDMFTFGEHPHSRVIAIAALADGSIMGATEFGVIGWKNGKQQILTTRNGLPCDTVTALISDNTGDLWLDTQCGIIEIPKDQMQLWWEHGESQLKLRAFDSLEGARSGLGHFNTSTKTPDGRLWFANGAVVQVIDPAHIPFNTIAPPVNITSIVADHKDYPLEAGIHLPPRTRDLEIDYTALSYGSPQKILFRYMLEGHDQNWQQAGTRRQAFYNDLRPGHYKFHVIACNNDGVWNEAGSSLGFDVMPSFYQTTWFRALAAFGFIGLLWGIYRLRVQQLQQEFNIGLEARVNERTRIARELHDTLLQTLHGLMFQFQAVRNLMPRRPDEAMRSLDDAINETEKALGESREAIQGLRSEPIAKGDLAELITATMQELANSEKASKGEAPDFDLIEEGERRTLSATAKNEVCRIAFEILRNAYRHAQAHRIEAEVRYGDDVLRVRIRDDGKGIDPKVLKEGGLAGHWGLRGIRERAERIGAQLEFWSEASAGTEVQLTVPASVAYENSSESRGWKLLRIGKNRAQDS